MGQRFSRMYDINRRCSLGHRTKPFRLHDRNESATDRYIWIDQVCIDQSNMDERNHQVRLMSIIYERAAFVVVWLDNTSHLRPEEAPWLSKHDFHRRILANRYFCRLWIVQEILLSSHIYVLCGNT